MNDRDPAHSEALDTPLPASGGAMPRIGTRSVRDVSRADAPLGDFGFDAADERWIEAVRQAEAPLPFGCLGPYELEEEISRGGQGIVFRARQPGTRRQVAVKRLLGGAFATPGMRRRFEREVEALTALHHPHIVTIFAMDVVDGAPVLAMEWIDGVPITRWAADGRRPTAQIVRMVLAVCDAVQHAHQRGVIHRDLKPSNILIDASGTPHVVDFGLAKFSRPSSVAVPGAAEHFVGTLAYASPEQLRGRDEEVDVRSDVYALGVILYELLTGARPDRPIEGLERGEPLAPGGSKLDRDLEAIARKALASERSARYQSADAFAADLRAYLANEPVSARPVSGWELWRKLLRRHRVAVGLSLGLLGIVSLFGLVTAVLAVRVAEQRDLAVRARHSEALARERAEQESAKARTINEFLEQMLAAADPRRPGDANLTVRDVLDKAAGRLESKLGEQPEVGAGIKLVLGRTYHNLGLLEPAESHLRSALELYRSAPDDADAGRDESVFSVLTELATVLHSRGDHRSAGAITEEAAALYRQLLAQGRPLLQADITGLAGYYVIKGNPAAAKQLYADALAAHRRILGGEHPVLLGDLAGLACLLGQLGERDEAARLAFEALSIVRRMPALETPQGAVILFDVARALHEVRAFEDARPIYEQALDVQRRVYGDDHTIMAETLSHYANLLSNVGDLEGAEAAYRRSLEIQRTLYGESHRGVAACQARLGTTLLDLGRHAEAEQELRAAVETLERILPPGHREFGQRYHDLGRCLKALAKYDQAEPYLLKSHAILSERHGADGERARQVRDSILALYESWGRPDEAAEWKSAGAPSPEAAGGEASRPRSP